MHESLEDYHQYLKHIASRLSERVGGAQIPSGITNRLREMGSMMDAADRSVA